jgi:hypothetical protein
MREPDRDVETVMLQQDMPEPVSTGGNPLVRKLVIGALISVIVVLFIILIYQIYKHYTADDTKENKPPDSAQPAATSQAPRQQQSQAPERKKDKPKQAPQRDVISAMDNAYLDSFITKAKASPSKGGLATSKVNLHKDGLETVQEHVPDAVDRAEDIHSLTLMEKSDDFEYSREQQLSDMRDEMDEDENTDESDLQKLADESDMNLYSSGCDFILTRGPRKGLGCGKQIYANEKCNAHAHK